MSQFRGAKILLWQTFSIATIFLLSAKAYAASDSDLQMRLSDQGNFSLGPPPDQQKNEGARSQKISPGEVPKKRRPFSADQPFDEGSIETLFQPRKDGSAPIDVLIGVAEGTRTAEGGKTKAYYGHHDPSKVLLASAIKNLGSYSFRGHHNDITPEEADAKQRAVLQKRANGYLLAARVRNINMTLIQGVLMLDESDQAPLAVDDVRNGFLGRLAQAQKEGLTGFEAAVFARKMAYCADWNCSAIDAAGFDNDPSSLNADQDRRSKATARALSLMTDDFTTSDIVGGVSNIRQNQPEEAPSDHSTSASIPAPAPGKDADANDGATLAVNFSLSLTSKQEGQDAAEQPSAEPTSPAVPSVTKEPPLDNANHSSYDAADLHEVSAQHTQTDPSRAMLTTGQRDGSSANSVVPAAHTTELPNSAGEPDLAIRFTIPDSGLPPADSGSAKVVQAVSKKDNQQQVAEGDTLAQRLAKISAYYAEMASSRGLCACGVNYSLTAIGIESSGHANDLFQRMLHDSKHFELLEPNKMIKLEPGMIVYRMPHEPLLEGYSWRGHVFIVGLDLREQSDHIVRTPDDLWHPTFYGPAYVFRLKTAPVDLSKALDLGQLPEFRGCG